MARAGWGVAAVVLAVVFGSIALVASRADAVGGLGPADWAAVRFTLWQAVLSAALSVGLAVPVARALARRRFAGRGVLVAVMGAPFILPVVTAVLGLVAVFGRNGALNAGLAVLGLPGMQLYGPQGVILGHVFFNLPLAVRLILQGWAAIPAERLRLAASLDFGPREVMRHLERPLLREVLPGAAFAVFTICLTSFAVALTLGGGPRATTVELAIYQAVRFDFDLGRAALLALVQAGLGLLAVGLALGLAKPAMFGPGLDRAETVPAPQGVWRMVDAGLIGLAAAFLLAPLLAVAASGLPRIAVLPVEIWAAAVRSLGVALGAAAVSVTAALALGLAAVRRPVLEGAGLVALAASPLVLGTGLFIAVLPFADPTPLALPVTLLVNALAALPFVLRAIVPGLRAADADYGRLAASLGMEGATRLWLVTLPRIRTPLGFAAGLAAALSAGDLGVIALFSGSDNPTLPLAIYRLIAAYRLPEAASASLVLTLLAFALFAGVSRAGRA